MLFIESVDADGDGDLHVVATAVKGEAVTGAGLVVFDVNKDLRPAKDPHAGDLVTGRYVDRFERRDGDWRIAVRLVVVEWRLEAEGASMPPLSALAARDPSDVSYRRPLAAAPAAR